MYRVFCGVALLVSSFAFGQSCTTSVAINVFDDRLHLDIQTLKVEDFHARMNGEDLPVLSSQQDYDSRLLVLLETDGSAKNSKLHDIVDATTRMARQAPEGKPVAFGIYAAKAVFTKEFIADPEKRKAEINAVIEEADSLGDRVALFDALHQALQLFGKPQPGDTILLIGSAYDDKSDHSLGEVEKEFLSSGTRLMAMLRERISRVGRGDFLLYSHDREKSLFLDFAERTGGAHSEWDPHFFGFAWRGYMLEVRAPERMRKPHSWSLNIPGLTGAFRHTKIFYPELLQPCQVTSANKDSAISK